MNCQSYALIALASLVACETSPADIPPPSLSETCIVECDGGGGGGGGGDASSSTSDTVHFDVRGWTFLNGSRSATVCNTFNWWASDFVNFGTDSVRVEYYKRSTTTCEEVEVIGGAMAVSATINGTHKDVARLEADFETTEQAAFTIEAGQTVTVTLAAEPYTHLGCTFLWWADNHVQLSGNPVTYVMDSSNSGQIFKAYFDCPTPTG